VASLLVSSAAGLAVVGGAPAPAAAADLLELRLEALSIPIPLDQLEALSRGEPPPATAGGEELSVWLRLLRPETQQDLLRLLRAPLLRDRSFGRQLLNSWAGSQMLAEVGVLLTTPDGRTTTPLLQSTLVRLLEEGREVTAIDLLRGLPPQRLTLQLDGLLSLAERWRQQLRQQQLALEGLQRLALDTRPARPLAFDPGEREPPRAPPPRNPSAGALALPARPP
jgi:hypothetical protein